MRRISLLTAILAAGVAAVLLALSEKGETPDESCSSCDARHQGLEKRRAATEKLRAMRDGN